MYQLIKHYMTGEICAVKKQIDENTVMSFLFDPDNVDYQQYLAWLNEGNVPEPAEEQQ